MIGVVNLISSGTSVFAARYFSRRFIFIWGHFFIGIAHIAIGVFAYFEMPNFVLGSMCCFCFFFQNSSGCITWLYCTEVAVDVVLGFVGFTGYLVVFILTLTTQFMMKSETLHAWGTFWMFGGISLIATIWFQVFLKETYNLNDK
jgi:NAD/NADP transhydrogenase beta subunit